MAVLACSAVDLGTVLNDRTRFQAAADAAALRAAVEVGISDPVGIPPRTEEFVRGQLMNLNGRTQYSVDTKIDAASSTVTVTVAGVRDSFFVNLLPPGGWKIGVHSTAVSLGRTPLCVLSTGQDKLGDITVSNSAQISAPACMVQSNEDIAVTQSAVIAASLVQSSGLASGNISPAPQIGAPPIEDPFASIMIKPDAMTCTPGDKLPPGGPNGPGGPKDTTPLSVPAGVHCGDIHVGKDQSVILEPGEHYFLKGKLKLDNNAVLRGTDVALIFDKGSNFDFQDNADIELEGRKSGFFAGFVLATTRENTKDFHISSSSAAKFLGTIYVPSATLLIDGAGNKVADQSAWTVIVAKAFRLKGSPRLVVNANYAGSTVPVPQGVGSSQASHLIK
jgi:hypothetical protein